MKKIGFLGLGVMGLSMALNVSKKIGVEVIGYDVSETQLHRYREMGGTVAASAEELYSTCDVLLQMLPTHAIIQHSVEEAIRLGRPGNIIVDLSSAAPDIILDLNKKAMNAGMFLLDSPVSGGNPMAEAGTLSIMKKSNLCWSAWAHRCIQAAPAAAIPQSLSITWWAVPFW